MSLASIALTLVGQALDSAKKPDQAAQIPAPNPRAPKPATLWALAAGDAPPGAASDEIHITTYLPDPEPLLALKYSGRTPRNAIKLPKWLTRKAPCRYCGNLQHGPRAGTPQHQQCHQSSFGGPGHTARQGSLCQDQPRLF